MPFYRCLVPPDSVPFEQRRQVARAFTDIHCGLTGAPRNFVHVAFFENEDSEFAEPYYIDGGNRAGRPAALKEKLLAELMRAFRAITGVRIRPVGRTHHRRSCVLDDGSGPGAARAGSRGPGVVPPRRTARDRRTRYLKLLDEDAEL